MANRFILTLACLTTLCPAVFAQELSERPTLPSLNTVVWHGTGTSLEALEGKTVVVLSYVTWCPKCDAWAPEMLSQLKAAAADKPVVILAITTDTPTVPGPAYMGDKNFLGPNILHGNDPTIDRRFGFSSLFNFAVIDAAGNIVRKSSAGSYYNTAGGGKEYSVARAVKELENPGEFAVLNAEMSADVKQLLWPMELGIPVPDRQMAKARRLLNARQQQELDAAIDKFLDRQLELLERQAAGEVPEQLQAYETASELAINFRTKDQGKRARAIATELGKDRQFKREQAARVAYARTLELVMKSPERREPLLEGFAKRFDGTYFAEVALETAKQPEQDPSAGQDAVQIQP